MSRSVKVLAVFASLASALACAGPAAATWPGTNGKIYFTCRPIGGAFAGDDICSINPDGSDLTNLTNTPALGEYQPEVSRDGTQVSFIRGTGTEDYRVWVANTDGSGAHQVTTVPSDGASWTADGRIGYRAKVDASTYEFQTVPAAGGAATTLLSAGVTGSASPPRFTTSGAYLYSAPAPIPPANTSYTQQIFVVADGTANRITQPQVGVSANAFPSWSPDGATVLYTRSEFTAGFGSDFDIYATPAAGGAERQITNTVGPLTESWPQLSPDGGKLLWEQQDSGHDFFHKILVVANPDGSAPVVIPTPTLAAAMTPVWAPGAAAPPPVVVPPPPTPDPPLIAAFLATAPKTVKQGTAVPLTLRCTGDTVCAVTFNATLTVPRRTKKEKDKKYAVTIKAATIAAKTDLVVKVTLPKAAKSRVASALKAGKAPTFKATVTASQPAGGPLIRKLDLTVKLKK